MRKSSLGVICCLLSVSFFLVINSCRKHDYPSRPDIPLNDKQLSEKFFSITGSVDPQVVKIMNKLKRHADAVPFFVKKNGFAIWDKAILLKPRQNTSSVLFSDDNNPTIATGRTEVLIPLVPNGLRQVTGALACTIWENDSVTAVTMNGRHYKWYNEHAAGLGINGDDLSIILMKLDQQVFGHTRFTIKDKSLLQTNEQPTAYIELGIRSEGFEESINSLPEEFCLQICWGQFPGAGYSVVPPSGSASDDKPMTSQDNPKYICKTFCDVVQTGDPFGLPSGPGSGTNPGGTFPGTGGGSGGDGTGGYIQNSLFSLLTLALLICPSLHLGSIIRLAYPMALMILYFPGDRLMTDQPSYLSQIRS